MSAEDSGLLFDESEMLNAFEEPTFDIANISFTKEELNDMALQEGREKLWDDSYTEKAERQQLLFMFQPMNSVTLMFAQGRKTVHILDMNSFPSFFNRLVDSTGCQLHAFGTFEQLVKYVFPVKHHPRYPLKRIGIDESNNDPGIPYTIGKSFRYHLTDKINEGAQSAIIHAIFTMVFFGSRTDEKVSPLKIEVYTSDHVIQDVVAGFSRHPSGCVTVEVKTVVNY